MWARSLILECSGELQKSGGKKGERKEQEYNRRLTAADRRPIIRSCGSSSCAAASMHSCIRWRGTQMEDISFYFPFVIFPLLLFIGRAIKQFFSSVAISLYIGHILRANFFLIFICNRLRIFQHSWYKYY